MKPVSIVVITKDEENNIKDCLDSLEDLDYPNYEIIVVDASKDNTPKIVKEYKKIRLVKSKADFSVQRNLGIKAAKYSLIASTDADCIVPKDWLSILVKKKGSFDGIGGNAYPPKKSKLFGKWVACLGTPLGGAIGYDSSVKVMKNGSVNMLGGGNCLFEKSSLKKVGGYNEKLKMGNEDSSICNKLTSVGFKLKYEPSSFVYHKTRDKFPEFIEWNIRRGRADSYYKKQKFGLFMPWSVFWFLVALVLFNLISNPLLFVICIWLFSLALMFVGSPKKGKLLIKRRKRICVSLITILTVIPILFYIRMLFRNLGEILENGI